LADEVAVTKTRWLRKFDTSKYVRSEIPLGANQKPTPGYSLPAQGCDVELTEIVMAGHAGRWSTLGFEAFGDLDSVPTNPHADCATGKASLTPHYRVRRVPELPGMASGKANGVEVSLRPR
jgi:hypothetical protein